MPYHVAINLEMGVVVPRCVDKVHWFTVYPNISSSSFGADYVCQCGKIISTFNGFSLHLESDYKR